MHVVRRVLPFRPVSGKRKTPAKRSTRWVGAQVRPGSWGRPRPKERQTTRQSGVLVVKNGGLAGFRNQLDQPLRHLSVWLFYRASTRDESHERRPHAEASS